MNAWEPTRRREVAMTWKWTGRRRPAGAALSLFPALLAVFLSSCTHAADIELRPQSGEPILLVADDPGTTTAWRSHGDWVGISVLARTEGGRVQVLADLRPAAVHHHRVDAHQLHQRDVTREGLRLAVVLHRIAAVLHHHRLAGEAADVRQCLGEDPGDLHRRL